MSTAGFVFDGMLAAQGAYKLSIWPQPTSSLFLSSFDLGLVEAFYFFLLLVRCLATSFTHLVIHPALHYKGNDDDRGTCSAMAAYG
jgi:hypothetical protein